MRGISVSSVFLNEEESHPRTKDCPQIDPNRKRWVTPKPVNKRKNEEERGCDIRSGFRHAYQAVSVGASLFGWIGFTVSDNFLHIHEFLLTKAGIVISNISHPGLNRCARFAIPFR